MPRTQALSFAIRQRAPFLRSRSPHLWCFQRETTRSRPFTHRPSLLSLSRNHGRPQLPFLYSPAAVGYGCRRAPQSTTLLTRFMTTERRQRWKQTLRWQLRFHAYFWPSLVLLGLVLTGFHQTRLEHDYPTPRDWSFWTRWRLRSAKYNEFDSQARRERVLVDWGKTGLYYADAVKRLEDPEFDGSGIVWQGDEGGQILVPGVGRTGPDVSAKSEQWRRGYHEALMGCARVAEHLVGMAKKKTESFGPLVPWDSVIGPQNPRPKPLPWDKKGLYLHPPREEDMEDAFAAPEVYYMRILTTHGFTPRQKLDAAIGYADYLDFKGLFDTAESMYDWALDIATGALPNGAYDVVDMKTGVINAGKEGWTSENVLRASTAMGVHYAKKGNVKQALPIFLSVLRARRALPPMPAELEKLQPKSSKRTESVFMSYLQALKELVFEPPYPPLPPSGNEQPYHSLREACEEVGVMTYIGEILFATSTKEREKGLSWTRDSVDAAEAVLWIMDERGEEGTEGKQRCRECLATGLDNWKQMTRQMARAAQKNVVDVQNSNGWLGLGIGKAAAVEQAQREAQKWEEEESQIELRKLKTASLTNPLRPFGSSWVKA